MLHPYMPDTSKTIQEQLNASADVNVLTGDFVCYLEPGHKIGTPKPLFAKIEQAQADQLRNQYAGKNDSTPAPSEPSKPTPEKSAPAPKDVDPAEVERLTQEVAKQGDVVRKLKTDKAEKSQIDLEVAKLLALKKELALASGVKPEAGKKGGKSKKGKKK